MRFAKLVPLALAAALPLAAQQPEKLTVSLDYSGLGAPAFTTNKPAYVAMFDLTAGGLQQLYPQTGVQRLEMRGRAMSPELGYINSGAFLAPQGLWPSYALGFAPYYYGYSSFGAPGGYYGIPWGYGVSSLAGRSSTGWHTVLVVASTSPLKIASPYGADYRVRFELERRGRYNNFDTDEGVAALLSVIGSPDASAEQVSTSEDFPVLATQMAYGPTYPSSSIHWCADGTFFADFSTLQTGTCPNGDQPPVFAGTMPVPKDTTTRKVDTTSQNVRNAPLKPGVISDPAEIRRVLESLSHERTGTSAAGAGPTRDAGAAAATRHQDPSVRAQLGADGAGTNPSGSGSARTRGPVENGTTTHATPAPSAPRLTPPPPPPPTPPPTPAATKPVDEPAKKP
jgi:hypothetical protein